MATEIAVGDLSPELSARLDAVPALASRSSVSELAGGLTNRNLRIATAEGDVVARLSTPESALLAINREHEHANSVAAAQSGAAPGVVAYEPEVSVLVVRYVDGRTWADPDVLDPRNTERLASVLHQLHAGPRFVGDFNMLELQPRYLDLVQQRGLRLPDRYLEFGPHVEAIRDAMGRHFVPTVPCHNDLLAANVIDTGDRLWLIDYEYSGNNDPFFELGNLWSEAQGAPDDLGRLVEAYVGHTAPALVARARLWGLMSKYGWTLWASIQDGTSNLDFDFWEWGMEKYRRAVADFDSSDFGTWLEEVRRGD